MEIIYKHQENNVLCACKKCAGMTHKLIAKFEPIKAAVDDLPTAKFDRVNHTAYSLHKFIIPGAIHTWLNALKEISELGEKYEYVKNIKEKMEGYERIFLYDVLTVAYIQDGSIPSAEKVYYVDNQLPREKMFELIRLMSKIEAQVLLSGDTDEHSQLRCDIVSRIQYLFTRRDFPNRGDILPSSLHDWQIEKGTFD